MEYPQTMPASAPSPSANPNNIDADSKILSDLNTVQDKISLCQSMLIDIQTTSQIDDKSQESEPLLTIIGFLEACVPRVRELINVGMTSLKEETLTKCFQVNDDLCKILNDVEHPENVTCVTMKRSGVGAAGHVASASASASASATESDVFNSLEFDAFSLDDQKQAVRDDDDLNMKTKAKTSTASAALEDLLAPPSSVPPPSSTSAAAAAAGAKKDEGETGAKKDDDDFDDFFDKRTNNSFSIDE